MKFSRTVTPLAIALAMGLSVSAGMVHAADASGNHSSSASEAVSDSWITTKVKSELTTTKGAHGMDVSVKTVDGVVTLTGVLPGQNQVDKAVAAAESVKGVKKVDSSGLKAKN